jgi:putative membrane protein
MKFECGGNVKSRESHIDHEFLAYIGTVFILALLSGINAHYFGMWILEILPVMVGLLTLLAFRKRFSITPVLLRCLAALAVLHLIGAHYSFSEVPFGNWLQDMFHLDRNPFDRITHFAQGVATAIFFRELLIRIAGVKERKILFFLSSSCALAFSAFYELLEFAAWKIFLLNHTTANILGAQGDPWDTHWDMFLGISGALFALLTLARIHDSSLLRRK